MAVSVRRHKEKWMVDVRGTRPDGTRFRDRRVVPTTSKDQARRWGLEREKLLTFGEAVQVQPIGNAPTLEEFWPRFMENHVKANRQKHSVAVLKESHWKTHLRPALGRKRLDAITTEDVQALKRRLDGRSPKTVNNLLSTLAAVLKVAVQWGEVRRTCDVALVKAPRPEMDWYEEDVLESLIEAARKVDPMAELVVLLGARAGLRAGEMIGLEWRDVDFRRRMLTLCRNYYRGVEGSPKGGRTRRVDIAPGLLAALKKARQLTQGPVLTHGGERARPHNLRDWMERAQRLAGIATSGESGKLHVLRHTFGSHLVQRGVNLVEVQQLMGHAHISTTMRYMHLAPGSGAAAVASLEGNSRTTAAKRAAK